MSNLSNLLNPVNRRLPPMSPTEREQLSPTQSHPSSPGSSGSDAHPEDAHDEDEMNPDGDEDQVQDQEEGHNEDIHVPNIPHNPDHRPHPNCPDTLACLPDTEGRPQHTLPVILRCAILGSPRKRLTIREIYAAMEGKYSYYRTAGQTWKQSVRHHLSLNRLFERQPRPVTDPGFGSYWTVNLAAPPGTKRPRKRGRPNKNKDANGPPHPTASATSATAIAKDLDSKRRGRPRKDSEPPPLTGSSSGTAGSGDVHMHLRSEDELLESDDDRERPSHTQMMHPFDRRPSLVAVSPHNAGGTGGELDAVTQSTIERLSNEVHALRQQAHDAVQLSIRLSDQLAQAHAEASRAKSSLRNVEARFEEESTKRLQAERLAEDESRAKREAQEALRAIQASGR